MPNSISTQVMAKLDNEDDENVVLLKLIRHYVYALQSDGETLESAGRYQLRDVVQDLLTATSSIYLEDIPAEERRELAAIAGDPFV